MHIKPVGIADTGNISGIRLVHRLYLLKFLKEIALIGVNQIHAFCFAQQDGLGSLIPVHLQPHQTGHRADRQVGASVVGNGIDTVALLVQEGLASPSSLTVTLEFK